MGSNASRRAKLPGLPSQTDLAYLAGLIDRTGAFITRPPGLKLRVGPALRPHLLQRFGGVVHSDGTWWQTQTAAVAYLLPAISPYVVGRAGELEAMQRLVAHHTSRASYHGDDDWREERERLRAAVSDARGAAWREPRASS